MSIIREALAQISIGVAVEAGRLTMHPLIHEKLVEPGYLTLDQALDLGVIQITEISPSSSVPELMVTNRGKQPVFLLDGEELQGAKQNRILNVSILIPGERKVMVPVSCVEQGRWSQESQYFTAANHAMPAGMRADKARYVAESLQRDGSRRSDQSALWTDVSERLCCMEVDSPTGAMDAMYREKRVDLDEVVNQLKPLEGQVGAVLAIDGLIVGMELFDCQTALQRLLPKIARSYAMETLTPGEKVRPLKPEKPVDFLEAVGSASVQSFESPGLGQELRLIGEGIIGAVLIHDEKIVHLNAFRMESDNHAENVFDNGKITPLSHRRRNRNIRNQGE